MTDTLIIGASVAAGAFVLWSVQGLLNSIAAGMVAALPF